MEHLDGYTLIDYIKSSIEILMNMKADDSQASDEEITNVDERN